MTEIEAEAEVMRRIFEGEIGFDFCSISCQKATTRGPLIAVALEKLIADGIAGSVQGLSA